MKLKFVSLRIAATARIAETADYYLQTEDTPFCLLFGKQILAKELAKAITKVSNIKPIQAFALVQGNRPNIKYCSSMPHFLSRSFDKYRLISNKTSNLDLSRKFDPPYKETSNQDNIQFGCNRSTDTNILSF